MLKAFVGLYITSEKNLFNEDEYKTLYPEQLKTVLSKEIKEIYLSPSKSNNYKTINTMISNLGINKTTSFCKKSSNASSDYNNDIKKDKLPAKIKFKLNEKYKLQNSPDRTDRMNKKTTFNLANTSSQTSINVNNSTILPTIYNNRLNDIDVKKTFHSPDGKSRFNVTQRLSKFKCNNSPIQHRFKTNKLDEPLLTLHSTYSPEKKINHRQKDLIFKPDEKSI